jgi:hypothetical protein
MSKKEMFLGLFAAILGFIGAIGGSYFSTVNEQDNWEKRFGAQNKSLLVEKKFALLEDLTELFVGMPRINSNVFYLSKLPEIDRLIVECIEVAIEQKDDDHKCDKDRISRQELILKRSELVYLSKAKVESKILLATVLFGPQTKTAIYELTTDPSYKWHEPDQEKINNFIFAMHAELLM